MYFGVPFHATTYHSIAMVVFVGLVGITAKLRFVAAEEKNLTKISFEEGKAVLCIRNNIR